MHFANGSPQWWTLSPVSSLWQGRGDFTELDLVVSGSDPVKCPNKSRGTHHLRIPAPRPLRVTAHGPQQLGDRYSLGGVHVVSGRFCQAVQRHNIRGLEFVPVECVGTPLNRKQSVGRSDLPGELWELRFRHRVRLGKSSGDAFRRICRECGWGERVHISAAPIVFDFDGADGAFDCFVASQFGGYECYSGRFVNMVREEELTLIDFLPINGPRRWMSAAQKGERLRILRTNFLGGTLSEVLPSGDDSSWSAGEETAAGKEAHEMVTEAGLPLSYGAARHLAEDFLIPLSRADGVELAVLEDETREYRFGWIFPYNSREFAEFRSFTVFHLGRTGRILVDRFTGNLAPLGTQREIDEYAVDYEEFGTPYPEDFE